MPTPVTPAGLSRRAQRFGDAVWHRTRTAGQAAYSKPLYIEPIYL